MAERSNAAVLKTVDCNRSGGSNPSLSAKKVSKLTKPLQIVDYAGVFVGTMPNHSSEIKILVSDSVSKLSQKIYSPAFVERLVQ